MDSNRPESHVPDPDEDAKASSRTLAARLREAAAEAGGSLTFETFMERALYEPGLGYYRAGAARFGAGGDFATAPEFSPLFSRTLARQTVEILDHLCGGDPSRGDVVELGPGTGSLAAAALAEMEALGRLPQRWRMLEVSAALRQEQERSLRLMVPHLLDRVEWLERLPDPEAPSVWLANEVLDALPVRRFVAREAGVRELHVAPMDASRDETAAEWYWLEADPSPELRDAYRALTDRIGPLPEGYTSEICTRLPLFIESLGERVDPGVMLFIDYGYPQREYYLTERHGGTLLGHYRHRAHDDPFFWPGLQDITAFVDFTAVADAGLAAGMDVLGYAPQGAFLLGAGLGTIAEEEMDGASETDRIVISQAVQRLTHAGDMGERYKVMALGRGYDGPLRGFGMADRRGTL